MQNGKKKLVLDHLIVQKMDDEENGGDDMQSILTFGAKAIFEEESMRDITYSDQDLDKLIEKTEHEGGEQEPTAQNNLSFAFAKVWSANNDELEDIGDDVPDHEHGDSWAQALERIAAAEKVIQKEATGRGVRRRAAATSQKVQVLDGIEGLEDTPRKGEKTKKKKKHMGKSGDSSDDDDAYIGRGVASSPNSSDGSDASMGELEEVRNLVLDDQPPNAKSMSKKKTKHRDFRSDSELSVCGLCGQIHPDEGCYMTESSQNLAEYRALLLSNTDHESWDERKVAIEMIDFTLLERGDQGLIAGQPLHLLKPNQPINPPTRHTGTAPLKSIPAQNTSAAPPRNPPTQNTSTAPPVKKPLKQSVLPNAHPKATKPGGGPALPQINKTYNWMNVPLPMNLQSPYQLNPYPQNPYPQNPYPQMTAVASSSTQPQMGGNEVSPRKGHVGGHTSAFRMYEPAPASKKGKEVARDNWRAAPQPQPQPQPHHVPANPSAHLSKRRMSPPPADANNSKRARQSEIPNVCPVCSGKYHLILDCPVVAAGPASIASAIARLEQDPSQAFRVEILRKSLQRQKKREIGSMEPPGPSNVPQHPGMHMRMP